MTLLEGILKDSLYIDFGADYLYSSEEMYNCVPVRYATVNFQLYETATLDTLVDRIRKDRGLTPLHPIDEYSDDMCENGAWYDFYISLTDGNPSKVASCIEAVVVGGSEPEKTHCIDLTPEEQCMVYERLDEQCRQYIGKSCEQLLAESRVLMEEDMLFENREAQEE